jgi:threonine/homoserine/homoserine lactone efflux protein
MLDALVAFLPVSLVLTLTPGVATALVVRNAVKGGRRRAFYTTAGNSIGVLTWACAAAVGIAAIVATSAMAFSVVKLAGAAVLIVMGIQALFGRNDPAAEPEPAAGSDRAALRDGLITSVSNPKLAVFFVALFPQFLPDGTSALPAALAMGAMIVAFDLLWYSVLAVLVVRTRHAFVDGPWQHRFERFTGAVLVGLGVRLAFERR